MNTWRNAWVAGVVLRGQEKHETCRSSPNSPDECKELSAQTNRFEPSSSELIDLRGESTPVRHRYYSTVPTIYNNLAWTSDDTV